MKRTLYILIIIVLCIQSVQGQVKFHYEYDKAGNRITREAIIINQKMVTIDNDSTLIYFYENEDVEDIIEDENILKSKKTKQIGDIEISAYPNPVREELYISVGTEDFQSIDYELYNISGQMIKQSRINKNLETINFSNLPPTTYILRIIIENEYQEFTIIKN